ncbi:MAG: amidohydrolase family protein [Sphaerochaeta sp.]|jgi:predicted TIM-barrel fold metal-dependent hydrolase|nr:amidohydrolase family protein [Sphaerochaeta sp.]
MINCHLHVRPGEWDADSIIRYLDRNSMELCWLLTWEEISLGPWYYQSMPVSGVYEAYARYPDRIIPFYAPDPHRKDAVRCLELWHRKGIRGCGELKASLPWKSRQVYKLLAAAEKLRMPVLFHMQAPERIPVQRPPMTRNQKRASRMLAIARDYLRLSQSHQAASKPCPSVPSPLYADFPGYLPDFDGLEQALRDFPRLNFIAHGPLFWKHIAADATYRDEAYPTGPYTDEGLIWQLLRKHPNLHADTSAGSGFTALTRDADFSKRFLDEFQDKILYGTDNVEVGQKDFIDSLNLPPIALRKIYSGNARRLVLQ